MEVERKIDELILRQPQKEMKSEEALRCLSLINVQDFDFVRVQPIDYIRVIMHRQVVLRRDAEAFIFRSPVR